MPLLEDVSTSDRVKHMEKISQELRQLIAERRGTVDIDDAIYAVAGRLRISPQQVHYGLALGMSEGDFALSSDGTKLVG